MSEANEARKKQGMQCHLGESNPGGAELLTCKRPPCPAVLGTACSMIFVPIIKLLQDEQFLRASGVSYFSLPEMKNAKKKKNKTKHLTVRVHPLFLTLREGMDKTAGTRFLYLTR